MPLRPRVKLMSTAAAVASGILLTACGGVDGVDLNGKLFDMMGISSAAQNSGAREPRMADRAPLVVPPSAARLPEPGSGKTSSADVAALSDPEQRRQAAAKERERLHLAYCRGEIQWRDKVFNPDADNKSPYGPCPSLFGSITGKVNK
jgi:hypothetical protein